MNAQRRTMLESIAAVREGRMPHRHAPFARHTMRIPESDFYAIVKLYPGLMASDPDELSAAWAAFEKSPISQKYHVGRTVRGVTKNGLILK